MTLWICLILIAAAALEVGGDALVRRGLRGGGFVFVILGVIVLGSYGIVVNLVDWDFSRLLGVYVAVFAVLSVLVGRWIFRETISTPTWSGLMLIVAGGMVIQFGQAASK